jgi:hypothetical protein
MAPFCFQVFSVRVERMCLHFLPKEKRTRNCKKSAKQRRKDECRDCRLRGEHTREALELSKGTERPRRLSESDQHVPQKVQTAFFARLIRALAKDLQQF